MNAQLTLDDVPGPRSKDDWCDGAFAFLQEWCVDHPLLFAEDVQGAVAAAVGWEPATTAWLGPVLKRLAAAGVIAAARDDQGRRLYRDGSNGSPKPLWQSQLYPATRGIMDR